MLVQSNIAETETYGVKYIGSKKLLLPYILNEVRRVGVETAIDVFSGTTRVAQYLRQNGVKTTTSDLSWATSCYAETYVHNADNEHLRAHITLMNDIAPARGWLTENYSGKNVDAPREDGRCFQPKNTMKADAARDYIETLELARWEKATLITSVIRALDAVDNTVGVQQAYLKEWCKRSYKDIVFELPACISGPVARHHEGNCLDIDYEPSRSRLPRSSLQFTFIRNILPHLGQCRSVGQAANGTQSSATARSSNKERVL